MLKKKIIASSISNLTDARYFAGWMVDYFIFQLDPTQDHFINPQEIGVFHSWVEGPKFYISIGENQFHEVEKLLVDFNCQGIILAYSQRSQIANLDVPLMYHMSFQDFVSNMDQLTLHENDIPLVLNDIVDMSSAHNSISAFKENNPNQEIFVEINHQAINEADLLSLYIDGFMVHGSPEEKVGVKTFEELDDIFEILQDF